MSSKYPFYVTLEGDGEGLLFRHGEILYKVPQDKLVDALMDEIDKL